MREEGLLFLPRESLALNEVTENRRRARLNLAVLEIDLSKLGVTGRISGGSGARWNLRSCSCLAAQYS